MRDPVYGVDGEWDISRCRNDDCASAYLDAKLTGEQLGGFYAAYGTHAEPVLDTRGVKRIFRQAVAWLLHKRLGYSRPDVSRWIGPVAALLGVVPLFRHMALSRVFWLPHVEGGKLVEIGFGNAQSLLFTRDMGWQVRGVEFDSVCIEKARGFGLAVDEGDFGSQSYGDDSLNAVVGTHVIEHVPDPGQLIASIHRKLVTGGRMVLVTPNGKSLGCRVMGRDWRGLETPRHLTIQTPGSLIRHAQNAGFRKIRLFGTPLGGGTLQQSLQIRQGRRVGNRGRVAQFSWAMLATLVFMLKNRASDEIVLFCEK
jgi:SAM-dependent methyltransferase